MVGRVEGLTCPLEVRSEIDEIRARCLLFPSMFKASDQYSMTFSLFAPWYNNARPLRTYLGSCELHVLSSRFS